MHPSPSGASRVTRSLAACAAIAVLASGIGLTTGAVAFAEAPIPGPISDTSDVTLTPGSESPGSVSEPLSEEPESQESPEPTETAPLPGGGDAAVPDTEGTPPTTETGTPDTGTPETPAPVTQDTPATEAGSPAGPPAEPSGAAPTPHSMPGPVTNGSSESTATNVAIGQAVTGTTRSRWSAEYYRLRAPSDGRVNLKFTFPRSLSGEAFRVRVKSDVSGNETEYRFNGGDAGGKSTTIPAALMPTGDFFVIVEAKSTAASNAQFALTVSHTALGQVEREYNNTYDSATFITAGKAVHGSLKSSWERDVFVMNTPQAGTGQLQFTFPKNLSGRTYKIYIRDAAQKPITEFQLYGSDADGSALARVNIPLPKGQVFVMIDGKDATGGQPYKLSLGMKLTAATPTIVGKAAVGSTLTAQPGTWGPGQMKFSYQWKRDGKAIAKATGAKYKVAKSDVGRNITVTVTGSRAGVGTASRTSAKKYVPTTFTDVRRNHKFYTEIQWMFDTKRTTGIRTSQGLAYQPSAGVTREAMAAFLFRQEAKKGYTPPKKSPFRDVPTNHKFYKEIAWMYEHGISTGSKSSAGRVYLPKNGVSREAMAAFLYRLRAPGNTPKPQTAPFADVGPGHKFAREIAWMKQSKLSTGSKVGGRVLYQPGNTVSREAMAAFLYRMDRSVPPKPTTRAH